MRSDRHCPILNMELSRFYHGMSYDLLLWLRMRPFGLMVM